MKKIIFTAILSLLSLDAAEIALGSGTFGYDFTLQKTMGANVTLDITVLSFKERRLPLTRKLFFYANLDIYRSKTLDDYAAYPDAASDLLPIGDIAQGAGVPMPVSFEMRGIDMSVGLGYTLLRRERSYLAVGVETGASIPYMETENMLENVERFEQILKTTKTDIMTYKLLPALLGHYGFNDYLALDGSFSFGYQFGSISNDYLKGDADFSGTVLHTDIALLATPFKNDFQFAIGYRLSKWSVTSMDVTVAGIGHDFSRNLDMDFDTRYFYLSGGWRF